MKFKNDEEREEFEHKRAEFLDAFSEEKEAASRASVLEQELREMGATGKDIDEGPD